MHGVQGEALWMAQHLRIHKSNGRDVIRGDESEEAAALGYYSSYHHHWHL